MVGSCLLSHLAEHEFDQTTRNRLPFTVKTFIMGRRIRVPLINSSPPSASYMRRWIRSALVQTMACRLFGAKPLSKIQNFPFTKMHLKISSAQWRPCCPGGDKLYSLISICIQNTFSLSVLQEQTIYNHGNHHPTVATILIVYQGLLTLLSME